LDDIQLIRAFQAGDASAFDTLVSRYRRQVYRIARGILRSHAQADEAAQDAFVKAWQGLASFRGESSFKTWMYRIAMNTAFDHRSREGTQARLREEAAREAIVAARPARTPRAVDELIHEEELEHVRSAIARLPERQRLTLSLKVHEGLKYTEIAEVLQCPVGTAKANFHHAVQNLKRYLGGSGPAGGARPDDDDAADESMTGDRHDA
jgi:RNA polymerase sigma-70 factor (ECF subfamily)